MLSNFRQTRPFHLWVRLNGNHCSMLRNQKGISIIEILMALVISSIITAAVISLLSNSLTTSSQLTKTAKLDQMLNNILETIAQDVQRAGYNANATTSATNVFFNAPDDVSINASTNCITFSYQIDSNTTPVTSNRFGYRLNTTNNAIEYRTSGTDCASGAWNNFTDPNIISIDNFSIPAVNTTNINPQTGNTSTTSPYTQYRSVTITITGKLVSDPSVTRTITRTIKIYNNKYVP